MTELVLDPSLLNEEANPPQATPPVLDPSLLEEDTVKSVPISAEGIPEMSPDLLVETEDKRPDTLPYIANQVARTAADLVGGGQDIIGGVIQAADPFNTGYGERIMRSGDALRDQAKESFGVTQKQQAQASFPQKLAGGLTAGIATLPMYASPQTAVAAIVFPAMSTATTLIREHGISDTQAGIVLAGGTAVNAAGYKVATLFPNVAKDTTKDIVKKYIYAGTGTGGVNVASNTANRAVISDVLEDSHPELAKKYELLDWEQNALDMAQGLVLGPGMKYLHDKGAKTSYERLDIARKDHEKHQALLTDSFIDLQMEVTDGLTPVAQGSGIGLRGAEKQLVRTAPVGGGEKALRSMLLDNNSQYTVADYITDIQKSYLAKDPEMNDLVKRITAIGSLDVDTAARSTVFIHDGDGATSLEGNNPAAPDFKIAVPVIRSRADLIYVAHELGHMATNGAIRAIENFIAKPPPGLHPEMSKLADRWIAMETAFNIERNKAGQDLLQRLQNRYPTLYKEWADAKIFDPNTRIVRDWDAFDEKLQQHKLTNAYGLTSLKEFIGTAFQSYLPRNMDKTVPGYSTRLSGHAELSKLSIPLGDAGRLNWEPPNHAQFKELFKDANELFQELGNNSFLKNMWDGVFQLASGQSTMQVDPKAMQKRAQSVDYYTRAGLAEIAHLAENMNSKSEFITRLEAMSSIPEWRKWAVANGELLYLNKDKIILKGREARKQIHDSMTGTRGRTESYATVDELENALPKDLSNTEDLPDSFNRWAVGSNQRNMMNLPAIAGTVIRFVHRMMDRYDRMGHQVYAQLTEHLQPLNMLKETSRRKVLDFGYLVDGLYSAKQEMKARDIWWPDDKMINDLNTRHKLNLTPEEIHAYKELGFMEARAFTLIEAINRKNGQDTPERIPGHMPHVWNGSYKVHVSMKKPVKGGFQHFKVRVMSFDTRQGAEAFAKEVNNGKHGSDLYVPINPKRKTYWYVTERKDFESGIVAGMYQDIQAYKTFLLMDPEAQSRIMAMDNAHTINFNSHLTERAGSDVKGHLGEFQSKKYTPLDVVMGKKYRDYRDYMQVSEQYAKRIAETFKDTMYIYDVHNRLFKANADPFLEKRGSLAQTMTEMPTLSKHIHELTQNYTGVADNKFKTVDQTLIDASIKVGIPPYMYRKLVKGIRDTISLVFTRYNPGNWLMNYVQHFHTFGLMVFGNEMRRRQGLSTTDVGEIFSEVFHHRGLKPDEEKALAWARDKGINEPQAEHQVRAKATTKKAKVIEAISLGKIPNAIEGNAREMSFLIAYKYFRKIHDDPTVARESAAELMGQTMVNYDRSHRPLMYQSFGVVGEALSPFAVYRNAWMANIAMMVKFALQKPAEFNSWKPLLTTQATFLAFAGMGGVIGLSEYDAFIRWMKNLFPEHFGEWPDGMTLMKGAKIPDFMSYGLLTEATKYFPGTPEGVNISGSGQAVGADDMLSPNIVPFATALASTFKLAGKAIVGSEITSQEKYETAVALLPGQARLALDKRFQEEGVDTTFHAGKLTGSTSATLADNISQGVWGKPSRPTDIERRKIRFLKGQLATHTKGVKKLVELAADADRDKADVTKYYTKAYSEYDISDDEFTKMIAEKKLQRQLPYVESLFSEVDSLINDKQIEALRKLGGLRQ